MQAHLGLTRTGCDSHHATMAGAEELDGDAELKLLIRTKLRAEWSSENLAHSLLDEKMLANVVRVFPDLQPDEQVCPPQRCLPTPLG